MAGTGGAVAGTSGSPGAGGGGRGSGGASGTDAGVGAAGAAGAPVTCPVEGPDCPEGCLELEVTSGCDANRRAYTLCTEAPIDPVQTSCGVRESDGEILYVAAPYGQGPAPNLFYGLEGFRPCTQEEIDRTDCRDLTDLPATRSVRFDVANARASTVWLAISSEYCASLGIDRASDGEELILSLHRPCDSHCGIQVEGYAGANFVRLDPGEASSFEWDGRAARTAPTLVACEISGDDPPWPEGTDDACVGGSIAPVTPGRYRASLLIETNSNDFIARSCRDAETCFVELDFAVVGSFDERCQEGSPDWMPVEFEIPESGDVVVPLTLED